MALPIAIPVNSSVSNLAGGSNTFMILIGEAAKHKVGNKPLTIVRGASGKGTYYDPKENIVFVNGNEIDAANSGTTDQKKIFLARLGHELEHVVQMPPVSYNQYKPADEYVRSRILNEAQSYVKQYLMAQEFGVPFASTGDGASQAASMLGFLYTNFNDKLDAEQQMIGALADSGLINTWKPSNAPDFNYDEYYRLSYALSASGINPSSVQWDQQAGAGTSTVGNRVTLNNVGSGLTWSAQGKLSTTDPKRPGHEFHYTVNTSSNDGVITTSVSGYDTSVSNTFSYSIASSDLATAITVNDLVNGGTKKSLVRQTVTVSGDAPLIAISNAIVIVAPGTTVTLVGDGLLVKDQDPSKSSTSHIRIISNLTTSENGSAIIQQPIEAARDLSGPEKSIVLSPEEYDRLKALDDEDLANNASAGKWGASFGSAIIGALGIKNPFERVIADGVLSTILQNAFEVVQAHGILIKLRVGDEDTFNVLSDIGQDFAHNISGAGVGALSSYLASELIDGLGLEGTLAGDLASPVASQAIGQIITNAAQIAAHVPDVGLFDDVLDIDLPAIFVNYVGGKLADEIYPAQGLYGQIGGAIGATAGGLMDAGFLEFFGPEILLNPVADVILIVVFAVTEIIGRLVGSLFGASKSFASVEWGGDEGFIVDDVSSRRGGSKSAARGIGSAIADSLNGIVLATGGKVVGTPDPQINVGLRNNKFINWNTGLRSTDPTRIIDQGVYTGLQGIPSMLVGGDIFTKRALLGDLAFQDLDSFRLRTLIGDISVARDYENYLANAPMINLLMQKEPDSAFAAGWVVTLARAQELGLDRRAYTDFSGGWNGYLDFIDGQMDGESFTPSNVAQFVGDNNERTTIFIAEDNTLLGAFGDTIDSLAKTVIGGTDESDAITITGDTLTSSSGLLVDGGPGSTDPLRIKVAAIIRGEGGDDVIRAGDLGNDVLGGDGNDILVGGKLDDWLFGEAGDDVLFAGNVANIGFSATDLTSERAAVAVDGGNGNLLDGGDGDDRLYGGSSSDWLRGGAGTDIIYGGDGGDIIDGGEGQDHLPGMAPSLFGGAGSDQYVFGFGYGEDVIFDESDPAGTVGSTGDSLNTRYDAINAGSTARNWAGGGDYEVDGSIKGGEDAIAFGPGVTMANLRITRSGTVSAPGQDLIIQLTVDDGTGAMIPTGDQLIIKDWFESTRRVEWFRFTNGDEVRFGDVVNFSIGSSGSDVIIGTQQGDFLVGEDGDDWIQSLGGDDFGFGGKGDDNVFGDGDNDFVGGGAGNDLVAGGGGNDTVFGDDGDDTLLGGDGADILVGGKGNDRIITGAGDDVVRFARGDGQDAVYDDLSDYWETVWVNGVTQSGYTGSIASTISKDGVVYFDGQKWINGDYTWDYATMTLKRHVHGGYYGDNVNNGNDAIEFAVGIDIQDVMFSAVGNDLQMAISNENADTPFDQVSDRLTFKDYYLYGGQGIEYFDFAAVGRISLSNYTLGGWGVYGTEGNDTIWGTEYADWITGNGGDDVIMSHEGNDILNGNAGDDILVGMEGDDILYGGSGNDDLQGGAGADKLFGGTGIDYAGYENDWNGVDVYLSAPQYNTGIAVGDSFDSIEGINGSGANDRLGGDAGDNFFRGGQGSDLEMGGAGDDTYQWSLWNHTDTIMEGVLTVTGTGQESVGAGDGGDDMIQLEEPGLHLANLDLWWDGGDLHINVNGSGAFIILDQTNADHAVESLQFDYGLTIDLTTLRLSGAAGTSGVDTMFGTWAADTLSGLAGNDVMFGADGADTLLGGAGDDLLEGGLGADTLNGGTDSQTDGLAPDGVSAWGDTASYASSSDWVWVDLEDGSTDNGDAEGDTIVMVNGVSTIENLVGSEYGDSFIADARDNRLSGLGGDDWILGRAGDDVISGGDGSDDLEGGDGDDTISGDAGDDYIVGGAGNDILLGGDGDDYFYSDVGADKVDGGAGNDQLYGHAGDDLLVGGLGDDILNGGADNDTYLFDAHSGHDTLTDTLGANHLVLQDVTADQVWLTRSGNDLILKVIGGDTQVTITGYFGATTTSLVRDIQLQDRVLYLSLAGPLIDAMTTAGTNPTSMPSSVAAMLDTYWMSGANTGPAVANQSFSMVEDGTPVSGAVNAVVLDAAIAHYSVSQTSGLGEVNINPNTGAWTFTPNPDANGTDTFEITVTDVNGGTSTQTVSFSISAVNDAPRDITASTDLTMLEGTASGVGVGILYGVDVDSTALTYSLTNTAGGKFSVTSDGLLQTAQANITAGTYSITAQVSDGTLTYSKTFSIVVGTGAHAPNAPVAGTIPVFSEGALTGTTVATFTLTDPDGGTPTLQIVSDPNNFLRVNGANLEFNSSVDFEALVAAGAAVSDTDGDGVGEATYTATVRASDGTLTSSNTTVTLHIENVNEAPTQINATGLAASFAERDHTQSGASLPAIALATLSTNDPDSPTTSFGQIAYDVSDSRFEVVNGVLRLKAGQSSFDFETSTTASVTVTAYDLNHGAGAFSTSRTFTFNVTDSDDYLYGGINNDIITGQGGRDIIRGDVGNDTLSGAGGADDLYGEAGNDILNGGLGNDNLDGGVGDDTLNGDDGADVLLGGDGADTLSGGAGDDNLSGGANDDSLSGNDGADTLSGGDGNDLLIGGAGADHFNGGAGSDTVSYAGASAAVTFNVATGGTGGDATGDVFDDTPEVIIGSAYNDTIVGKAGVVTYQGGAGNDDITGSDSAETLYGGDGDDIIHANGGNDNLYGGAGSDNLYGGSGDDTYHIGLDAGADTIHNYDSTGSDLDVVGYDDGITRDYLWFARSGDDLVVSVIGTSVATTVKDWFVTSDPGDYKIDFFIAQTHYTYTINAEGLTTLMAGYTKPTTQAAFDTLHANSTFQTQWSSLWAGNQAAKILAANGDPLPSSQTTAEDTPLQISIKITDDVDVAGASVTAFGVSPTNSTITDSSIVSSTVLGSVDGNGVRTLTLNLASNASGTGAVKIRVVDAGGLTTEQVFTLNVTPVADLPSLTVTNPTVTTLDSGSLPLSVTAGVNDPSETLAIRILGVPSGLSLNHGVRQGDGSWSLVSGDLTGLAIVGPSTWSQDLSLTIQAIATDGGDSRTNATTLSVPINARPTDLTLASGSLTVNENTTSVFATLATTDADGGAMAYSLTNNPGGRLSINSSGQISVASGHVLDYEAASSWNFTVQVTDNGGLPYSETFTIHLNDTNEAPTGINGPTAISVGENVAGGSTLTTYTGIDPEGAAGLAFSLLSNPGGLFSISAAGVLSVANGVTLDHELNSGLDTVRIQVSDGVNTPFAQDVVITITDVDEAPTNFAATGTGLHVVENATNLTTPVGAVQAVDPEGHPVTYTLVSGGDAFQIDATSGAVTVLNGALLNFEANPIRTIRVRATDVDSLSTERDFLVTLTDVNEAPRFFTGEVTGVLMERPEGPALPTPQVIANLRDYLSDPDAGDHDSSGVLNETFTYEVIGGDSSTLGVNASGQLVQIGPMDYEGQRNYSITVRATGSSGLQTTGTFGVATTNVNEAPVFDGPLHAYDPDGGTITYSMVGFSETGIIWEYRGTDNFGQPRLFSYNPQSSAVIFSQASGYAYLNRATDAFGVNAGVEATITIRATDSQGQSTDTNYVLSFPQYMGDVYIWSPVVLDLNGDGLSLVSFPSSTVGFDMDGDGKPQITGWVGASDALLALDRNGDGLISNGKEISFTADKPGAVSDLEGLQAFDTDGDGKLDAGDARFADFKVWRDLNQDGVSQAGELATLTQAGIASIDLHGAINAAPQPGGDNLVYATATFTRSNGSTGIAGDVFLAYGQNPADGAANTVTEQEPAGSAIGVAQEGPVSAVSEDSSVSAVRRNAAIPESMAASAEDWGSRWTGLFGALTPVAESEPGPLPRASQSSAAAPPAVDRRGANVNTPPAAVVAEAKSEANAKAEAQRSSSASSESKSSPDTAPDPVSAVQPVSRASMPNTPAAANDVDDLADDMAASIQGYARPADLDLDESAATAASALDDQLALASQMRFRMVEAMSSFAPTDFMSQTQQGRMKDLEADKLLTALPDYRIVANG